MKQKTGIGFGFRGWLLIIYMATAIMTFTATSYYPMNILADLYGGNEKLSTIYTIGSLVGIVIQLIISRFIGKIKSVKLMGTIFGVIVILAWIGLIKVPAGNTWLAIYFVECSLATLYAIYSIGMLVGQWFPRRKGAVMGVATFAFPITNGLIGTFAGRVFGGGAPNVSYAYLPFLIVSIIGWVIGLIFVKDYPEQCGAYRDNNPDISPEIAKAMMETEIQNKKNSLWKFPQPLACREFWFAMIGVGFMLMCSVGLVSQTKLYIGAYENLNYSNCMYVVMVSGLFGSWLLGVIDNKIGTRRAIMFSCVVMLLCGIFGSISNASCLVLALVFLGIFQGAGSNYAVSICAQYWRREDFSSVYAVLSPLATALQCLGPMWVARTVNISTTLPFHVVIVVAIVAILLMLLFRADNVKAADDKLRQKAGRALDDALVGRK